MPIFTAICLSGYNWEHSGSNAILNSESTMTVQAATILLAVATNYVEVISMLI